MRSRGAVGRRGRAARSGGVVGQRRLVARAGGAVRRLCLAARSGSAVGRRIWVAKSRAEAQLARRLKAAHDIRVVHRSTFAARSKIVFVAPKTTRHVVSNVATTWPQ